MKFVWNHFGSLLAIVLLPVATQARAVDQPRPAQSSLLLERGLSEKTARAELLPEPSPRPLNSHVQSFPESDLGEAAMSQLTSVAELSDVKPNDWAYQALKSLIERYGAIAGYSDLTFRGNQSLTRYEFAAALIAAIPTVDFAAYATEQDLETLKRMQTEFAAELAVVKGNVSRMEQVLRPVSETTKLTGEVILAPIVVGEAKKAGSDNEPTDSKLAVGSRVKLNFITNLGGKTQLRTTLKANNIPPIQRAAGTDMARLSFQGDTDNLLELDELSVRSRLNKRVTLYAFAAGGGLNKFTETLNPFLSSSGDGSISRFGQRNPIYRLGGDVGLGFSFRLNPAISLDIGYLADKQVNDPAIGLGSGAYGTIAQLTFELSKTAGLGLTYVRSFNLLDTNTGSGRANDPFADSSRAIVTDSLGIQAVVGLSEKLVLSGWFGFSKATAKDLPGNPSASILNWAVTLAVPNLGQEGNLLGLVIGQPPKVAQNDFRLEGKSYKDADASLHLEAFYRVRLNTAISMTPGFVIITRPEHRNENDPIFIGTLRTTFSF